MNNLEKEVHDSIERALINTPTLFGDFDAEGLATDMVDHDTTFEGIDRDLLIPHIKTFEKKQNWFFTFGSGQDFNGRYLKIFGTFQSSRKEMFYRFGRKWSMQYTEEEFAGQPEKYNLTELK